MDPMGWNPKNWWFVSIDVSPSPFELFSGSSHEFFISRRCTMFQVIAADGRMVQNADIEKSFVAEWRISHIYC